jgi:hypothetical protein
MPRRVLTESLVDRLADLLHPFVEITGTLEQLGTKVSEARSFVLVRLEQTLACGQFIEAVYPVGPLGVPILHRPLKGFLVAPGLTGVGSVGIDLLLDRLIVQPGTDRLLSLVDGLRDVTTLGTWVELVSEVVEAPRGWSFPKRRARLLGRVLTP